MNELNKIIYNCPVCKSVHLEFDWKQDYDCQSSLIKEDSYRMLHGRFIKITSDIKK